MSYDSDNLFLKSTCERSSPYVKCRCTCLDVLQSIPPFAAQPHGSLDLGTHVQARLSWEAMAFKMYVGVTHIAPAAMTDEEVGQVCGQDQGEGVIAGLAGL